MIRVIGILLLVVVTTGHAFFMADEGYDKKVHDVAQMGYDNNNAIKLWRDTASVSQKGYGFFNVPQKRFANYNARKLRKDTASVPQKGYGFFNVPQKRFANYNARKLRKDTAREHNEWHKTGYGSYGPRFRNAKEIGVVRDSKITGTSGMCASRSHPGYLYTVNDHGDGPFIYVLNSKTGKLVSTITVKGAVNADWEDLACGPCPGKGNCIYIADSGNDGGNNALYSNTIYRIKEPASIRKHVTVCPDGKLEYCWKEFDAETLMVDPYANLYLISRTKAPKGVSKIAYIPKRAWKRKNRKRLALTKLVDLTSCINGAFLTSGDISRNGKEILLLTLNNLYLFTVTGKNSILSTLSHNKPVRVPYKVEPKGQAVCFDAKGQGYFTLGEGERQTLYYYERKGYSYSLPGDYSLDQLATGK